MKKLALSTLGLISGLAYGGAMEAIPATSEGQVTLMNWTEQPYNHWAFRNAGVHPSLMVPRGGEISPIPYALDENLPTLSFKYQGEAYTVRDAMTADSTDGYIVIKNGKIIAEEYFNGMTERDHHLWASSTKSVVGQAMGLLVEQGKVSVDDMVQTYIPELKNTHFGKRTVRDVLNMVSALDYSEDYVNFTPGEVSTEYFRRLGFVPAFDIMASDPKKSDIPRSILEFLPEFEKNPDLEPRDRFEYHSPNVDIAGWIISRVSGQPLQTFVSENFWSKLGAEHDAFFMADVGYMPIATGGFNTTLRDFARVGLAMVNNGQYNGEQIFPKNWVKDTFKLTDKEREQMSNSIYKDPQSSVYDEWLEGYKNYLWVHDSKKGIATFRGVFGQHLYINQEKNIVIATFSSAESASNAARETNKPRLAAFEAIANHY
ncbi:serine hydrolase domain-containing protein [Vibrio sonorensis]|uniref:serine hydrolase domain-containing protein n=1 Tax=Vibrio sonorensis TaxID=1004316 RepID=UPI0008DAFC90|nr:serine hydrolase [Vibrio sonorensis]